MPAALVTPSERSVRGLSTDTRRAHLRHTLVTPSARLEPETSHRDPLPYPRVRAGGCQARVLAEGGSSLYGRHAGFATVTHTHLSTDPAGGSSPVGRRRAWHLRGSRDAGHPEPDCAYPAGGTPGHP